MLFSLLLAIISFFIQDFVHPLPEKKKKIYITWSLTGAAGVDIDILTHTIPLKVKEKLNLHKYKNVQKQLHVYQYEFIYFLFVYLVSEKIRCFRKRTILDCSELSTFEV